MIDLSLKPFKCPFCKSRQIEHCSDEHGNYCQCKKCFTRGPIKETRSDSIKAWNIRV